MINSISGVAMDMSTTVQPIKSTSAVDTGTVETNVVDTSSANGGENVKKSDSSIKTEDDTKSNLNPNEKDKKKDLSEKDVVEMSDALNKFMEQANCNIKFDYYEKLNRLTMKIVDRKTDKIIKEFPPKEMLDVLVGIREWIGVLLDKKV